MSAPAKDEISDSTPQPELLRALGLGSGILIVVGSVIGSGIFLKPGKIAAEAGDFRIIIAAWIFGGLLCLLGALCFAELAAMFPQAGGLYVYLRETYGKSTAFCFGWTDFLFVRAASTGALSVAFVNAAAAAAGFSLHPALVVLCCTLLLATIAAVNVRGVLWGARLQNATTFAKAGGVLFLALLPFALLLAASDCFQLSNYLTKYDPAESAGLPIRFAAALLAVMWAYDGWHQVTPITEEVRNPQRNIPRALLGGVLILMALYVSANLAYHGVMSMSELAAESSGNGARAMAQKALGPVGGAIVSLVIVCSTFGTICNNLLTTPRVPFAMARDRLAPKAMGLVHVVYRTPSVAICVQATMAAALVLASAVYVASSPGSNDQSIAQRQGAIFDQLTEFAVFTGSIFYAAGVLAVLVLRRRKPGIERPYRTWGYPATPVLFLAAYSWFLFEVFRGKPFEATIGLAIVGLSFAVFFSLPAARAPKSGADDAP